jgi:hypothetical protein
VDLVYQPCNIVVFLLQVRAQTGELAMGDRTGQTVGDGADFYQFDEWGDLVGEVAEEDQSDAGPAGQPCEISMLNGSWLLQLTPLGPRPAPARSEIRGPMRIEVAAAALRVSGDVYVRQMPFPPRRPDAPPLPPAPWYPQLPLSQYSWYFRSTGATFDAGTVSFGIERHLWDRTTQEFVGTDTGEVELTCRQGLARDADQPMVMRGRAKTGGQTYVAVATKTSESYRGLRVEVDAMTGRVWPQTATLCSGVETGFRQVYATAGWDVQATVDELKVPEDTALTNVELQTLLATHRGPGTADEWRLWLLVGSAQGSLFGIMFDDDSVPREGAVGFADAMLGNDPFIEANARGKPLDEVPSAYLRTLVHEAGHALNLFHPKHDVHNPPIGTEIMNQTGDVMGFATEANPYPCNATFAFAEHDRLSLIHAPDPQVRPGWKGFGWGHGSLSTGLPLPVDADGLLATNDAEGLRLDLRMPTETFVGEYVTAEVVLTNVSDESREVTTRLNLAEGDLRLLHAAPGAVINQIRDVVVACGPRPTTMLAPGESLTGRMQVYFTNEGITFDQPGPHTLRAELDVDGLNSVRSQRVTVHVRTAATQVERDIAVTTLDPAVGMALALGDFGRNEETRENLAQLADEHPGHDTAAAGALVLANALARPHMDVRAGVAREAEPEAAQAYLEQASQGRSPEQVLELAVTVASPTEKDAPVVQAALDLVQETAPTAAQADRATEIAEDFVAPSPR